MRIISGGLCGGLDFRTNLSGTDFFLSFLQKGVKKEQRENGEKILVASFGLLFYSLHVDKRIKRIFSYFLLQFMIFIGRKIAFLCVMKECRDVRING